MIDINSNIKLIPILPSDTHVLKQLMQEVYPPAYQHFWKDGGGWYVNTQYSEQNILNELQEKDTEYYFVQYKNQSVGNFRIIWNALLPEHSTSKTVKLHRIYLHNNVQGKGVGKALIQWLIQHSKLKGYELLWLDAMNEKEQAFDFYTKLGFHYHSHCFLDFELLKDDYRKMSQLYLELS